jgi:hypothetical protein
MGDIKDNHLEAIAGRPSANPIIKVCLLVLTTYTPNKIIAVDKRFIAKRPVNVSRK